MADKIANLSQEQAALEKAMADATTFRDEEKQKNTATIKEAHEGAQAVRSAIAALKEFYSAQGSSFVQSKQAPEMEAYKGMKGESNGVLGMLEVVQSDFTNLESDTRAAEDTAAAQYREFIADSKKDAKTKHDEEFQLGLKKDQAEFDQEQLEKDLDVTAEQLDMAQKYYSSLKPQCAEEKASYQQRVAERKQEIEALKEAYKVLNEVGQ
eukprot:gnl/TRDRNA2_/TRDRNA2_86425_c0_seq1.p1 gnl/TRDRNA2_/TRDRNA2_86425_c0~~gnl/TRDRNA2_/TRDRNA2_86425_c0_seq1.p1  ORF type:complete len:229 (-),score=77.22 gnl/TRDRNA2_/TRDRNA2_86425_c0_seq1:191-820(-)